MPLSESEKATHSDDQRTSRGQSAREIHDAILAVARPAPGLRWLDIGCGRGDALRLIHTRHSPAKLTGVDLIDWLAVDLRDCVDLTVAPAEEAILACAPADRVLLIECLDDLDAPWSVLCAAARLVLPGGWLVVSVPNIASLRSRIEFALRGYPSAFRPDDPAQRSLILAHIVERVLLREGLDPQPPIYALPEIIPFTGGRKWPTFLARHFKRALNTSMVLAARCPS
jgi:SAM-dependent methyltransferase